MFTGGIFTIFTLFSYQSLATFLFVTRVVNPL